MKLPLRCVDCATRAEVVAWGFSFCVAHYNLRLQQIQETQKQQQKAKEGGTAMPSPELSTTSMPGR